MAGELSGDQLGADLMRSISELCPNARFAGVGGPEMIAAGLQSWFDLDRLSVNGYIDPLKRLPDLIHILRSLRRRVLAEAPAAFIGVDFSFFNLRLEGMLKRRGIPTVHYVSPSVWAWRRGRLRRIARSVDLMLTLFPFETEIYRQHNIRVAYAGHPGAREYPENPDTSGARQQLGFALSAPLLALLPGSRSSEVRYSGRDFIEAALLCQKEHPDLQIAIAAASHKRKLQLAQLLASLQLEQQIVLLDGQARQLLEACDLALINGGTATLEAMFMKKPMVMSYRLGRWSYRLAKAMLHLDWFALPNILAGRELVPERIQDEATPEKLAKALLPFIGKPLPPDLLQAYHDLHAELRLDDGQVAARAVLELVRQAAALPA